MGARNVAFSRTQTFKGIRSRMSELEPEFRPYLKTCGGRGYNEFKRPMRPNVRALNFFMGEHSTAVSQPHQAHLISFLTFI